MSNAKESQTWPSVLNRRHFLQKAGATSLAVAALGPVASARNVSRTVRVALIGREGHTGLILRSLPKIPGAVWVAYAKTDPDEDESWVRRQENFSDHTRIYSDYRELLEQEEVDVVAPCMPFYRNAEVSIAAVRKGIHVISEKPAATELPDLKLLKQVVEKSGVSYSALLNMRCTPLLLAARKAVRSGLIGEPILVNSQKSYRFGDSRPEFYKERKKFGGTIPWAGIHAIDYMRWVGGVEYLRVAAHHGNKAHPDYPGCEDYAGALFQLSNGGTALCNIDYLRPQAAPSHGDDRLRLAGSDGVLEVRETEHQTVLITRAAGPRKLELPPAVDLFADFVAHLRGEGEHIIGPGEAIRSTRACLRARQAADEGSWLEI